MKKIPIPTGKWQEVSGLQAPEVIRQFDGYNGLNSFSIKDSHATRSQNFSTAHYPALGVRQSSSTLTRDTKVSSNSTVASSVAPMTYGANTMTSSDVQGIGLRGKEIHMIANGTWYVIQNPGEAWTVVKKGLNTEYLFFFVNFQGNFSEVNLIATNGFDRPLKYAGGVVTELANAPDWANFVCTHDNRLYMSKESTIYFSALRKAEDWSTVNDSGQIVVETTDGLDIRGLVAGSAHLTVFKLNSMWELYGTNPSNYELKMVSDNLGSPTGNSAQVIDGVIYFLGNDGVYRYAGGSMPSDDFSIPVRNIVRSINQDYSYRAVSWQSEKKYYLSFPSGSSTKCDTILEFDTERNVWNTWVTQYAVTARGVNLDGMTYAGCSGGYVYRFDGAGNGGQIVFDWVSKPYTMGSMAAKARWFKMWVVADIPSGATLNIHLSTEQEGDDSWTLVQSVTPNTNIQSKEIPIPILLTNQSNWVRVRLEGTGQVVVHELTRQLRIFPFGQG